jgi:hypothetical protein
MMNSVMTEQPSLHQQAVKVAPAERMGNSAVPKMKSLTFLFTKSTTVVLIEVAEFGMSGANVPPLPHPLLPAIIANLFEGSKPIPVSLTVQGRLLKQSVFTLPEFGAVIPSFPTLTLNAPTLMQFTEHQQMTDSPP